MENKITQIVIDFSDGKIVDISYKFSGSNELFSPEEFGAGTKTRLLLEKIEKKVRTIFKKS